MACISVMLTRIMRERTYLDYLPIIGVIDLFLAACK
jgi:hypothetical protein